MSAMEREQHYKSGPEPLAVFQTLSHEVQVYISLCQAAENPDLKRWERKAKHEQMRGYIDILLAQPDRGQVYRAELECYAQERNRQLAQGKRLYKEPQA